MKENKKNVNWETERENGVIKFFKIFITFFTLIFFCKSFENNTSFENMLGISISSIYDYYILSGNAENDNTIKNYAKIGIYLHSICLFFFFGCKFWCNIREKRLLFIKSWCSELF